MRVALIWKRIISVHEFTCYIGRDFTRIIKQERVCPGIHSTAQPESQSMRTDGLYGDCGVARPHQLGEKYNLLLRHTV